MPRHAVTAQWPRPAGGGIGSIGTNGSRHRARNHRSLVAGLRLSAEAYEAAVRDGVSLASDLKVVSSAAKVRVMLLDENSGKIGTVDVPVESKDLQQKSH